jgi:predicted nucleic acid-binding protein
LAAVYFDTSVFLAIFKKEPDAKSVRDLLAELRRDKIRIYTSIITIQEVSVASFKRGVAADDNSQRVGRLARVHGITKQIALTAAKLEAALRDKEPQSAEASKRRKWDCFHVATALVLGCQAFYALDKALEAKWPLFGVPLGIAKPRPAAPQFDFMAQVVEVTADPPPAPE